MNIQSAASEFLAKKRIAITGVSRTPGSHGSNVVYRRLQDRGYEVSAVNPNASAELGIKHVGMHRGPGAGSVSPAAADYGRK